MKIYVDLENNRIETIRKAENSVIDVNLRWKNFLAGDTISSSTFTADAGVTIDSDSNGTDETTAVISGGDEGGRYRLTNQIITAAGNTYERDTYIWMRPNKRTTKQYYT